MPKSVTNNLNDPMKQNIVYYYRAFHGFGQAKFPDGLRLEPQLPLKIMLDSKSGQN